MNYDQSDKILPISLEISKMVNILGKIFNFTNTSFESARRGDLNEVKIIVIEQI